MLKKNTRIMKRMKLMVMMLLKKVGIKKKMGMERWRKCTGSSLNWNKEGG